MDPEDIPTGFPYAEPPLNKREEEARERDAEKLQAALSCGPQCASSVLATRYAKILRQERLLAMAASALHDLQAYAGATINSTSLNVDAMTARAGAIRRQIDEERGNPA